MTRYKPYSAICHLVLFLTMTPWLNAFQDVPAPADTKKPAQNTIDYTAVLTFREVMKSHSFALPEEKVKEVVLACLRKDTARPPKSMPTVEQLQGDLDLDFEAAWTEMIDAAAAGLDPNGKLNVAVRLRNFLVNNPQLRADAKEGHDSLLKNDIPKALERVKGTLVKEQQDQLIDALKGVASQDMPGQTRVCDSVVDRTPAINMLTTAVVEAIQLELRETLLVESFAALSEAADNVVSDGVTQLEEQLQVLEKQPAAVSRPAIQKEIESRLKKLADRQQAQRAGDPLRPSYGVFSRVNQDIPVKAGSWFDQRVADVGNRVFGEVASGERRIPSEHEEILRRLILANLPAHHQPSGSLRAVQSKIQEMTDGGQQWIVADLVKALQLSKTPDDQNYPEKSFHRDINGILTNKDSLGYVAWSNLQKVLQRRYETDLLSAVRKKIADELAREYAPELMNNSWSPTEAVFRSSPLPLQPDTLTNLRVWKNAPPQPKETVLQETWELWLNAAQEAFKVVQEALNGQQQVVEELRSGILDRISNEQERTLVEWVEEYSRDATDKWKKERQAPNDPRAKAATRYPDLLPTTTKLIEQIVKELLPLAEDEKAAKQPVAPKMKEEPPQQPVPEQPPQADSQPKAPEVFAPNAGQGSTGESEPQGKTDGSGESGEVGGQGKSDEEGNGKAEDKGAGESAGEEPKAGDGKGEGEDEGGGKKKKSKRNDGKDELASAAAPRMAPAERSLADLLFQIIFWILLILVLVMALGWYWHVRYLRQLLGQYRRAGPLNIR
jgi:dihydroneopterin aldolase